LQRTSHGGADASTVRRCSIRSRLLSLARLFDGVRSGKYLFWQEETAWQRRGTNGDATTCPCGSRFSMTTDIAGRRSEENILDIGPKVSPSIGPSMNMEHRSGHAQGRQEGHGLQRQWGNLAVSRPAARSAHTRRKGAMVCLVQVSSRRPPSGWTARRVLIFCPLARAGDAGRVAFRHAPRFFFEAELLGHDELPHGGSRPPPPPGKFGTEPTQGEVEGRNRREMLGAGAGDLEPLLVFAPKQAAPSVSRPKAPRRGGGEAARTGG